MTTAVCAWTSVARQHSGCPCRLAFVRLSRVDGGPATGRGFHVLYSSPPLNQTQAGPSVRFAQTMRDQLTASGIPTANYIGSHGLDARSDIAGLNLAQYPSILVECGNMKNPADSGLMESVEGRQKYADAVVKGITAFLATQPPRAD